MQNCSLITYILILKIIYWEPSERICNWHSSDKLSSWLTSDNVRGLTYFYMSDHWTRPELKFSALLLCTCTWTPRRISWCVWHVHTQLLPPGVHRRYGHSCTWNEHSGVLILCIKLQHSYIYCVISFYCIGCLINILNKEYIYFLYCV